ncbi:class I SAM-dependent methyltransferase [Cumulibacter manganitolerans]|uniref:class I SAM-dependent methyltransferase n=1 Tax=Cumulibacter manganitolerans TaxID=1884992 RepID=UPI001E2BA3CD|nr:methyltransferase [Cumulibacter manganitolerans]
MADLGCGNGVLAIASARANPDARYLLVDESAAALASARRSWTENLGQRAAAFTLGDGLADAAAGSLDVVLCNPPFHAGTTVDEWVGVRLLEQARRALRPGGALYVVANRHLRHHRYLREAFDAVEVLGADARFSALRAVR